MAEFPNLGMPCAFEHCHELDFLPFICDGCHNTYCLEHRQPSDHQCINPVSITISEKIPSITTRSRCSSHECKNSELVDIICNHCNANFCLIHRHQQDHNCTSLNQTKNVESKTSALVKSILESKNRAQSNEKPRPLGKRSLKLAAQVNLMKMKITAIGNKKLPQDERVYLMMALPSSDDIDDSTVRPKSFYFSKTWSVGRVIDHVAAIEKLRNGNNITATKKLLLFANDGKKSLTMDSPLEKLVSSNALCDGDTVTLKYV